LVYNIFVYKSGFPRKITHVVRQCYKKYFKKGLNPTLEVLVRTYELSLD